MFDPAVEPPIRLDEIPRRVAWLAGTRPGKKLSFSTLWRWATKGIRGHRLEVLRVGGALCTSEAALKRFFAKLTAPPAPPGGSTLTPSARVGARRAEAEADMAGIR